MNKYGTFSQTEEYDQRIVGDTIEFFLGVISLKLQKVDVH